MNIAQQPIQVQIVKPWNIRRPMLYRYLDRQFVDEFFETGVLRLSSFELFAKHPDEQRNDAVEGVGVVSHTSANGHTLIAAMRHGSNAYVLCGSTRFDERIAKAFGTNAGFRINDTVEFAARISAHVPGFTVGFEGPCHYVSNRIIHRDGGTLDLAGLQHPTAPNAYDLGKAYAAASAIAADDLPFMKDVSYADQNEYRLIWLIDGPAHQHLHIHCPEAVRCCTRFEDLEEHR